MTVDLVPIFDDNYVFVLRGSDASAVVVDPGEASAVTAFLKRANLRLEAILITHHHADHVGGVADLLSAFQGVQVFGPRADVGKWSFDFKAVGENDAVSAAGLSCRVLEVPGHTLDHVAYWFEKDRALFSGDVLFGLGCGRLFEGTAAQMFESLSKIKALPADTNVYCTHEYTEKNLKFVEHESPPFLNPADLKTYETRLRSLRSDGKPSVPLKLGDELLCNPMIAARTVEEFRDWRKRRDWF